MIKRLLLTLFLLLVALGGRAADPLYCVIDLSGGPWVTSYPVSGLANVPSGGWTDEYRTTKLVMRRIGAGTFKKWNEQRNRYDDVTLAKQFYMGVFEVTQRQWELVMGAKPSYFNNSLYYESRPVEQVSYSMIRGSSAGAGWPAHDAVDATSFLGKLRTKAGLDFDLPTDAQWEYACRAGTTSDYNNGGSSENDLKLLGRYRDNGGSSYSASCAPSAGTAKVGSYLPNAWGLYDMHGNVAEWCLDWYVDDLLGGESSNLFRVLRGGSWQCDAGYCTSSYQDSGLPSGVINGNYYGFRLSGTLLDIGVQELVAYTVSFYANGGTPTLPAIIREEGAEYGDLPTVTRTGYMFDGWEDPIGGKVTATTKVTRDIMLRARWVIVAYPITYNLDGGTNASSNPAMYTIEDAVTLAAPTRSGYTFSGWTPNSGKIATGSTGAKTFTATWTMIVANYTISFNANGGGSTPAAITRNEGAEYGELPTVTRAGYAFDGWYTAASGGTKVTATTKVIGNVTLYAHWVPSPSGAGDVFVTSVTAQQQYPWNGLVDVTVTMRGTAEDVAESECLFAATNSETKAAIPVEHITRNGDDTGSGDVWTRKFIWDIKADVGAVRIDDVALMVGARIPDYVQLWEDGPFWAKCNVGATKPEEYGYYFWWGDTVGYKRNMDDNGWISVKDSTSFSFSGGNCPTHGKDKSQLQADGYIDAAGNLVAAHDAATAHLDSPWRMPTDTEVSSLINNCTTRWTTHNGVKGLLVMGSGAYSHKSIFFPAAGRGYDSNLVDTDSVGSYRSSSGSRLSFSSSYLSQSTSYSYFGWPVRPVRDFADSSAVAGGTETHFAFHRGEVSISFNAQGGSPTPSAITLDAGSEYGELPTVTRSGYTFDGWYTAATGGTKVTATMKVTGDATLYAHWAKEVNLNYAGYIPSNNEVLLWKNALMDELVAFSGLVGGSWIQNGPLPADGYNIKRSSVGVSVQFQVLNDAKVKCVTVLFEQRGTDVYGKVTNVDYAEGTVATLGVDFDVLRKSRLAIAINDHPAATTDKDEGYGVKGLVVRKTVTKEACTIVFNANGGSSTPAAITRDEGSEYGELPMVTRTGYTFDGWYTAASGGTKVTATTKVTGDVTLYAHWVESVSLTSVTAQQRYPRNGLVDIVVTIQGTAEDLADLECAFAAMNSTTGAAIPVSHITRNGEDAGSGTAWTRKFIWDAKADIGVAKIDDVALTVEAELPYVQLWKDGPCWAKCNVGATEPEECGYYFWWGDTVGYKRNANDSGWVSVKDSAEFSFGSSNCSTYDKDKSQLQSMGYVDATGNLVAAHDAATVHLGAPWRMPTDAEFSALINNCTIIWTTRSGVVGRLVTGKGSYSSKSIFLPTTGIGNGSGLSGFGSYGVYWSSSPYYSVSGDSRFAWMLYSSPDDFKRNYDVRAYGYSVRPVRELASSTAVIDGVTTHLSLDFSSIALVSVTAVTAQQRYPSNGLVDITVTIQGASNDVKEVDCLFAATNSATGEAIPVVHITRNGDDFGSGTVWTRKFIWDARADVGAVKIDNVMLAVDVGLRYVQLWENGPYWAKCNVGAEKPEECGYYFWWGDTVGYKRNENDDGWISVKDGTEFSFQACPTHGKDNSQLQSYGYIDATGNLVAEHDAATAHLGAPWRMPTGAEFSALISNCTTAWTKRDGVYGRLVTGKGDYATKSVFFPAGSYWSSTPTSGYSTYARPLYVDSDRIGMGDYDRRLGETVRPVREFASATAVIGGVTTHLPLDFSLSVISVTAQQRYPSNGLVDLVVEIHGTAADVAECECVFTATNSATGASISLSHIVRNGEDADSGATWTRKFIWDAKADVGAVKIDDVVLMVNVDPPYVQLWENGPFWAKWNIGATEPEECGYYFWWGDMVGYKRNANNDGWISVKNSSSFWFNSGECPTYDKSNSQLQSAGYIDATGNLVAEHDAATAHLGASWRMPTDADFSALISNCTTAWTTRNGVNGYLVTGREAYASKSVFFPAAGIGQFSDLSGLGSCGCYWSSSPDSSDSLRAWQLYFSSSKFHRPSDLRRLGQPVRPVREFSDLSGAIGGVAAHLSLDFSLSVMSIVAQPQSPRNGLVDITVTIQGAAEDVAKSEWSFAAINNTTKTPVPVVHIMCNGDDSGSGTVWTRKFIWDAKTDVGAVKIDDVALTIEAELPYVQLWENGPYWARCNVGATEPEEYGYYFWWGDTVGCKRNANNDGWISVNDSTSFSFNGGKCQTYAKSNSQLQSAGYIDATGNLVAEHDAATVYWGDPWRMPTVEELEALVDNCDTEWTTRNGVSGCLVKGKGVYSSKSIFLPAAGLGNDSSIYGLGSLGRCWASTPDSGHFYYYAWHLYFSSGDFGRDYFDDRYYGRSVRPVRGFADPSAASVGATTYFALDCREATISFNPQGGLPTPLAITLYEGSEYGELPVVARSGYTFDGWYTAASGGTKVTATTKATGDATLYAHWTAVKYAITYNLDGGKNASSNPATYTVEDAVTLAAPTRSGYTFSGWTPDNGKIAKGSTGAKTFTATWSKTVVRYAISFDANGGGSAPFAITRDEGAEYGELPMMTRTGYAFDGWYTAITGGTKVTAKTKATGNVTLYAHWTAVPAGTAFDYVDNWDGTITLMRYTGALIPEQLVIPSEYDGKKVTGVGLLQLRTQEEWDKYDGVSFFGENEDERIVIGSKLKSVKLSEGIETIGINSPFAYQSGITSVEFPSTLKNIGDWAFCCCTGLKSVDLSGTALRNCLWSSFAGCTSLTDVKFPSTVTTLGGISFAWCRALKSVTFMGDAPAIQNAASDGGDGAKWGDWAGRIYVDSGFDFKSFDTQRSNPKYLTGIVTYVKPGSSGWGSAVPGVWQGNAIAYIAEYNICFVLDDGVVEESLPVACNAVAKLPTLASKGWTRAGRMFCGWRSSANGRLYDDGMLVFCLAKPGETVTMTAIWE